MHAKLIVVSGRANRNEVDLKLPTVIGRSAEVDLTIAHPTVSRRHCEVFEHEGALMVRDLGSLNGTLVGDARVKTSLLKPGDVLTVGPLALRVDYAHEGVFPVLENESLDNGTVVFPASEETIDEPLVDPDAAASETSEASDDIPAAAAAQAEVAPPVDSSPTGGSSDLELKFDDEAIDWLEDVADAAPSPSESPAAAEPPLAKSAAEIDQPVADDMLFDLKEAESPADGLSLASADEASAAADDSLNLESVDDLPTFDDEQDQPEIDDSLPSFDDDSFGDDAAASTETPPPGGGDLSEDDVIDFLDDDADSAGSAPASAPRPSEKNKQEQKGEDGELNEFLKDLGL